MKRTKPIIFMMVALILSPVVQGQGPDLPKIAPKKESEQLAPDKPPSGTHELTAPDVEAFLDGIVPLQLLQNDIAGATISVVKDGKLLFAKGYGYADVATKKPVSPDETLFRPGSVSKLFTWTAVMQMAEQGKLDLDRDVNEYLDFKIPEKYGQPITLKNIMTHTPGFEEQIKDLFVTDAGSLNLGEYLKTHTPERIFPPGTTPAYSNYATALAGYIVERVSGQPFNEYIETNIFKPLGMTHSTFVQPLPPSLAPHMSNGYQLASDAPKPFEVVNAFPAGSLSSTANDMSRFMIAHLKEGQLDGARILRPETVRLMHSRLFALDDAVNAMAYGFYEESRNGRRIIGHGGDTQYFHSDLHLILDAGIGFFISYNSAGKGSDSLRTLLWEALLDRYLPYTPPPSTASSSAAEDAKAAGGTYMLSRRSETSFLKTATLLGEFTVVPSDDGVIEVAELTGPNGKPKRWRAVAPMTFLEDNGQDKLVFKPDQNGQMMMVLPYPFFVGQRVGLFENNSLLLPVLIISLLIMILTLLLWPVAWFVRRHYGHKLELTPTERRLRLAVRIVFALDIIFIAAMTGLVMYGLTNIEIFSDRGNKWFYLIQVIGILGAIGTLVVLYNAIKAWANKRSSIWYRLQATVLVLACLGFIWFALAGNLLRFSSTY
ncbi:MAG TPA: serine hydrolase domain-containing protein [Blastocatellia bacterium]|nr:serine hydrolase domain-containing protein [Blastocatellia bacterium]